MSKRLKLSIGFLALVAGALTAIPLPELGIPMVLLGTRLLGERYAWASALNQKVDTGWARSKSWFKKAFRRNTGGMK